MKDIPRKLASTVAVCGAIFAAGLYLTGSTSGALWVLGTAVVIGALGILYT
jgi:hypothetical protein